MSSLSMNFSPFNQSSMVDNSPRSNFTVMSSGPYKHESSKLFKAYLGEPTLPDLTIHLSDQTVHAHRIVLCRGSEYFTNMLTGRFQVSHIPFFLQRSTSPN